MVPQLVLNKSLFCHISLQIIVSLKTFLFYVVAVKILNFLLCPNHLDICICHGLFSHTELTINTSCWVRGKKHCTPAFPLGRKNCRKHNYNKYSPIERKSYTQSAYYKLSLLDWSSTWMLTFKRTERKRFNVKLYHEKRTGCSKVLPWHSSTKHHQFTVTSVPISLGCLSQQTQWLLCGRKITLEVHHC